MVLEPVAVVGMVVVVWVVIVVLLRKHFHKQSLIVPAENEDSLMQTLGS